MVQKVEKWLYNAKNQAFEPLFKLLSQLYSLIAPLAPIYNRCRYNLLSLALICNLAMSVFCSDNHTDKVLTQITH
jgi:hypothetical protein